MAIKTYKGKRSECDKCNFPNACDRVECMKKNKKTAPAPKANSEEEEDESESE